jgi:hypothetical protein
MTVLQIIGKLRKQVSFFFLYNFIDQQEVIQIKQKQKEEILEEVEEEMVRLRLENYDANEEIKELKKEN